MASAPKPNAAPTGRVVPIAQFTAADTGASDLKGWLQRNSSHALPVWMFSNLLDTFKEQIKRIKALETELAALTARQNGTDATLSKHSEQIVGRGVNGARWGGTYEPNHKYASGELVTCDANLWIATTSTSVRPGSDPTSWRLVLRRGKA
jgi:hypothetical protein